MKGVKMRRRLRRGEKRHLFSCLLGLGQVTWATPKLLPKNKRRAKKRVRERRGDEGDDDEKQEGLREAGCGANENKL